MRLYTGQIPVIADEILQAILKEGDIEVLQENFEEVKADIEAVLREWLRTDRELTDQARDLVAQDSSLSIGRAKSRLAKRKHFKTGDEAPGYIINQLIEVFLHSNYVEEVYSEDPVLRKRIQPILARHTQFEDALDQEVRNKLKNLQEGSRTWDIEYQKVMESLKHSKNLE